MVRFSCTLSTRCRRLGAVGAPLNTPSLMPTSRMHHMQGQAPQVRRNKALVRAVCTSLCLMRRLQERLQVATIRRALWRWKAVGQNEKPSDTSFYTSQQFRLYRFRTTTAPISAPRCYSTWSPRVRTLQHATIASRLPYPVHVGPEHVWRIKSAALSDKPYICLFRRLVRFKGFRRVTGRVCSRRHQLRTRQN
jgi:hypothetical protein